MRRRDLLTAGLASSATAFATRAGARSAASQRLLVIFLRGGYDALNVVIPTYCDFYYEARPTIAIPKPNSGHPEAARPLDGRWSLHPALKDTILPLWEKKQINFIPFAGTDDMSRSHFATQDTIELGQQLGRSRDYRSGFMARLADQIAGSRPIAFTSQPPLAFQGAGTVPNIAVAAGGKPAVDDRQAKLIEQMYQDRPLQSAVATGFSVRDKAYASITGEMAAANRYATPARGLEFAFRRVARMMKTDYDLAFLDVGGWDTHINQGGASGPLADRIGQLGKGLAAFVEEIGPETWDQTTVVVLSEFGRTFRENGDKGTDHGHGSVYWVLGGAVAGGRIVGDTFTLSKEALNQDRDLPVLSDYRSIIGSIAAKRFKLSEEALQRVFPNITLSRLDIA